MKKHLIDKYREEGVFFTESEIDNILAAGEKLGFTPISNKVKKVFDKSEIGAVIMFKCNNDRTSTLSVERWRCNLDELQNLNKDNYIKFMINFILNDMEDRISEIYETYSAEY